MGRELWIGIILAAMFVLFIVGGGTYLSLNYAYRWNQQCANVGGVKMENISGGIVCVKGPVQIVTIAARPW